MPARRFGVPAVDRSLGEIPAGGLVLLRHDPMVDAAPFALQAAVSHLERGDEVVVLVTNRSPSRTLAAITEFSAKADPARLHFIDAHSALLGAADVASYAVKDPSNLLQVVAALEHAARDHAQAVLVVDSLSGLLDHVTEAHFLAGMPRLAAAARRFRFCAAVWTAWPYSADVERAVASADAVVALRGVEDRVVLHQTLSVERSSWSATTPPALYKVDHPGGVMLYVPKVVVLGPGKAGKSTFVHSVAGAALSVERMGTTVALDRGTAILDGVRIEVFGTPGQARFDPLLPALAQQAVGAILVVDATEPASFPRAHDMLRKIWGRGLHAVVALNKSDLPGAVGVEDAAPALDPPAGVRILACVAIDAAACRKILQALVDEVLAAPAVAGAA